MQLYLQGGFWPQDALQRAVTAIRETRSNDFMVLARKALETAVRNETNLLAILEPHTAAFLSAERVMEPTIQAV